MAAAAWVEPYNMSMTGVDSENACAQVPKDAHMYAAVP